MACCIDAFLTRFAFEAGTEAETKAGAVARNVERDALLNGEA